ncbi:MAG TPA: SIS domain-containing protein [Candidatus Dormibacteraeota bacterium]|nr:SIS domain-containing protein [Candidatus Dormibacteraeota bacterium]
MSRFRDEIGEQPGIAAGMLSAGRDIANSIGARIKEAGPQGFVIAARGSSDHAALYAKYLFGRRNRALVSLAAPSLFTHYGSPPRLEGQCVIGISQSGSSPDVIAVIEEAVRQGALTIALTNNPESRLAAAAELVLPLGAGPEHSVPASKTYTASLLALALLSQAIDPQPAFETALGQVPGAMEEALAREAELDRLAPALLGPRAIVLARGFNLATAEEVALKLTETSYILARAWSVADFAHGPIAVVDQDFPVLFIGGGGPVAPDLEEIGKRLDAYGCRVIGLFDGEAPRVEMQSVGIDSGLPEDLTPLTLAILGQLLAHRVAVAREIDPDRPRALNKVTRTW